MRETRDALRGSPFEVESPAGLRVQVNQNGSIRRIDHGDIILNLFLGSEVEGGPANLYLRRHRAVVESIALLGPSSPATLRCDETGFVVDGEWSGIRFRASLVLAASAPAWFWHVRLENVGASAHEVDLVYAQDLALAHYGAVRMNEYYVSQYVDYAPLAHAKCGTVLAVRQNLSMGGRHPWLVLGALGRAASFATDALDLHGLATRAGEAAPGLARGLPGRRRQHEHSMAVLQDARVRLEPGARVARGFFAWFEPDHPEPTSVVDLTLVDRALALPEATPPTARDDRAGDRAAPTIFSASPVLRTRDLDDQGLARLFGADWRHVERDGAVTLSFFTGESRHVVTRAKELRVLRPHGSILRTGDRLAPDEASLTTTAWMGGVFHSMLTQGHVNINRFLSTTRSYLGFTRSTGQRLFVETADGWSRLDVPSAFEMTPGSCRWIYAHAGGVLEVQSRAATDRHELALSIAVLEGAPCRFLVSHHVALAGDDGVDPVPVQFTEDGAAVLVRTVPDTELGRRFPGGFFRIAFGPGTTPECVGGDELLFADGVSRAEPFLVFVLAPTRAAELRITGGLIAEASPMPPASLARDAATEAAFWRAMGSNVTLRAGPTPEVAPLVEMLPWLAHDALIHYLAPRGLEQYSGGGWGTRDVSQGPVELLLTLGHWDALRDLLGQIFGAQNPDGDWPQWFTFFERDRGIRAGDSHGDIVFWPLAALAEYLARSDDADFLDAEVPFFHRDGNGPAERATVLAHVERALAVIDRRTIPGTHLVAYGHGDWNDSLQPVDPAMRERLCSAWTVTLHVQMLTTLGAALRRLGRAGPAARLEALARPVRDDFRRLLLPDGILAGFGYVHDAARLDYWVHPRDGQTGMRYSVLAMIHAILNDLLTPAEAGAHVAVIGEHLMGVDGVRLFDRPSEYHGGRMRRFQRAETSTFFGREIGLMYMHAHLRYAEAMAHYGDAEAFVGALRRAVPIALGDVVPGAARRQANCYYSSSDAAFLDRYEAQARYNDVRTGRVGFEGGWRVYSSGAGILLRLIRECLLGLRSARTALTIDPVLPPALDGLRVEVEVAGRCLDVQYRCGARGVGPVRVTLNGSALPLTRLDNPYRSGGVVVPMRPIADALGRGGNELVVALG
jgi:cellobiose phosphorylase